MSENDGKPILKPEGANLKAMLAAYDDAQANLTPDETKPDSSESTETPKA